MLKKHFSTEKLLVAILGVFFILKLITLSKYHLPIWDEGVYLGMGKYIYSFGSSGLWENIRPIGLPLMIGWLWKLRLPYILSSQLVVTLFGVGSLILTYLLARRAFSKRTAVLSVALLATSYVFFKFSSTVLTDVPALFFVMAALLLFIENKYALAGMASGIAALIRFPAGIVLVSLSISLILAYLAKKLKRGGLPFSLQGIFQETGFKLARLLYGFSLAFVPFLTFNYFLYKNFTGNAFDAASRPLIFGASFQFIQQNAISNAFQNYGFYLTELLRQHIAFAFLIPATLFFFKRKWFLDKGKLSLAVFLTVFAGYFTYISLKEPRYAVLFLPVVAIFAAAGFFEALRSLKSLRAIHLRRLLAVSMIALLSLSLIISIGVDMHTVLTGYEPRISYEPDVVKAYRSVSDLGIKGGVYTPVPLFAAYNDNRFSPYYFTHYKGVPQELFPINEWERGMPFEAVIISSRGMWCPGDDAECAQASASLPEFLESNYDKAFEGTYYEGRLSYSVFVNNSVTTQPKP